MSSLGGQHTRKRVARLGGVGEWQRPYSTLRGQFSLAVLEIIKRAFLLVKRF